jgi:hypothetical protein
MSKGKRSGEKEGGRVEEASGDGGRKVIICWQILGLSTYGFIAPTPVVFVSHAQDQDFSY